MAKYDPQDFVNALNKKINKNQLQCPFCGGQKFTTTKSLAAILIGNDARNLNLGPHIPSGMIVCENCGHIEFFALGALGLMEDAKGDGERDN